MSNDNVVRLIQPGAFEDQLTEVLRSGARALLAQAVEAEVAEFLAKHADLKTENGRRRVVRHGHLPEREVMTGIGPVAVRQPRVRDRAAAADDPARIRFTPAILPPYMRRSKSIETLLPVLYLKGISTGDFSEALAALLGKDAAGLSASAIGRLKDGWQDEHAAWARRDLAAKTLRLRLGRRHPPGGAPGGREAVHPGADRRDTGRQEGAGRLHRRRTGKRRGLARPAARSEAPRACHRARARHRRRRARLLEGGGRGVAEDARAALLGAQDRERLEQAPRQPAAEGQARLAGDLDGGDEGRGRDRVRRLHARATRSSTRRRRNALPRIATRCSPSTTSLPSTGSTCAPPTRSRAPSRPCATARSAPRAASPTRPRSPWSSSWSRPRRGAGGGSTVTPSCQS